MTSPGISDSSGVNAQAALVASGHAFAVTDARLPDLPLVWVNPAFERLTGYVLADVKGRNCRLLQGPDTDRRAVQRIKDAVTSGGSVTETLLNYRKDGSTWWNQVTITPVLDDAGDVTHYVGVQSNADARVLAGQERDDARAAAEAADAQLNSRDRAQAIALQRSLLPALPVLEGLELAARYLPGSDSAEIGGDWYDVLPLPDGSTGIAVGDVMGHDMRAAGAMGQLRSVLRSYAWEGYGPAEVLDRLNQLVCGLGMAQLATCVYARIEPARAGRPASLRWSNAGHPSPIIKTPDGAVEVLDGARSVLIGVATTNIAINERPTSGHEVAPGTTLLFYTDGLIEDRNHDLDTGVATVREALASADPGITVDSLADRIIAAAGHSDHDDDQCVLVVRIG